MRSGPKAPQKRSLWGTIPSLHYSISVKNVELSIMPPQTSKPGPTSFRDLSGIKPCPDLSPISRPSEYEMTLIRKKDSTPLMRCTVSVLPKRFY
ncbi:hypothetical protein TNCV_2877211 [Trichonephila clavipes]|uniref:Uncharacterized protein n=1 Tax=Trichonephila clavipes TaxID=2585209 RepID=A0A8X7BJR9_TRICX|nr:hypothetical protein TNCV_2877211 [Trichonephila clavipes]